MKKLFYVLSIISLCVAFAFAQEGKSAVISCNEPVHDFGVIKEANGPVVHTFVIKNIGTAPLVVLVHSSKVSLFTAMVKTVVSHFVSKDK